LRQPLVTMMLMLRTQTVIVTIPVPHQLLPQQQQLCGAAGRGLQSSIPGHPLLLLVVVVVWD
jgi:hypothetical protein